MEKNIHLVFLDKNEEMPIQFKVCVERIKNMHSSWNITEWDEENCLMFLQEFLPEYVDVFKSFKYKVQKADFIKVALVYVLGGFYIDMDMYLLNPLDELIDKSLVLAEEFIVSNDYQDKINRVSNIEIANYMFGGEKGHPFLQMLLDEIASRVDVEIKDEQDVINSRLGLLSNIYFSNIDKFDDVTFLKRNGMYARMSDGSTNETLFGKYAVHLHVGTWKEDFNKNKESAFKDNVVEESENTDAEK